VHNLIWPWIYIFYLWCRYILLNLHSFWHLHYLSRASTNIHGLGYNGLPSKGKLQIGEAFGKEVLEKFLNNNTHVRAPMPEHSAKSFNRNNSAFMEMGDYLNIPTVPEGGWNQGRYMSKIIIKKKLYILYFIFYILTLIFLYFRISIFYSLYFIIFSILFCFNVEYLRWRWHIYIYIYFIL